MGRRALVGLVSEAVLTELAQRLFSHLQNGTMTPAARGSTVSNVMGVSSKQPSAFITGPLAIPVLWTFNEGE